MPFILSYCIAEVICHCYKTQWRAGKECRIWYCLFPCRSVYCRLSCIGITVVMLSFRKIADNGLDSFWIWRDCKQRGGDVDYLILADIARHGFHQLQCPRLSMCPYTVGSGALLVASEVEIAVDIGAVMLRHCFHCHFSWGYSQHDTKGIGFVWGTLLKIGIFRIKLRKNFINSDLFINFAVALVRRGFHSLGD